MDRLLIGIIMTTLISSSCFSQTTKEKMVIPNYFPIQRSGNIDSNEVLDSFLNFWYSKQLFALNEPILFSGQSGEKAIFRMTILRTFANPYTIRIENSNDSIFLYWKECDGSGGYEPGELIKDKKKTLSIEQWITFDNYMTDIDFWNLPLVEETDELPVDGTTGIFEGLNGGKYHMTTKWNHEKVDFSKCFLFLVGQTDIEYKVQRD
jgi:hypothetical protein